MPVPNLQKPALGSKGSFAYVHIVDWSTIHRIRAQIRQKAQAYDPEAALAEGGPPASAEDLSKCWLTTLKAQHEDTNVVTERDEEFVRIRVRQTMREVDPQGVGKIGIDVWCNHMLLTRSSPAAMRAMLHINRLMESALQMCPSILVALQHSFEVAEGHWPECMRPVPSSSWMNEDPEGVASEGFDREQPLPSPKLWEVAPEVTPEVCSTTEIPEEAGEKKVLPLEDVLGVFARKLWPFRPKCEVSKRRSDFVYNSPGHFVEETLTSMDLDGSLRISAADFLALCLGRQEWPVALHLYDLSRGVASMLAPLLLNQEIEGVWHTGIVVYGKEYYFGGDIFYDTPANTGFGTPRLVIPLGSTLRQRDELHAFIVDELKPIFNREAYDAARNNCNHFTDRVSMYLVGRHIPEDILDQPQLILDTSLGRALRPAVNRLLGRRFEPLSSAATITAAGSAGGSASAKDVAAGGQSPSGDALLGQTLQL